MLTRYASVLEDNIERVVDSVVRNINAGRAAVPDFDGPESDAPISQDDDDARETIADLCGHVAIALKALDVGSQSLATYKAPEPPVTAPVLDLVR